MQSPNFEVGPFICKTFDRQKWSSMKNKLYVLNPTHKHDPELQLLMKLLKEINDCPDYHAYFGEPSIEYFFLHEFLPAVGRILIYKQTEDKEFMDIINSSLELILYFWLKALDEDWVDLTNAAKLILDPTNHNRKNILNSKPLPEHLLWLQSLTEGELIDCMKFNKYFNAWSHARVVEVKETLIQVLFLNEPKVVQKVDSCHVAPYKTRCHDFEWRASLKEGDEFEVKENSVWYPSTVLQTRITIQDDGSEFKELYVAFRIYTPNGTRRYKGYPPNFDKWLSLTSPRIFKKDSIMANNAKINPSRTEGSDSSGTNIEISIEDDKKKYVVIKPGLCYSTFFLNLVENFGNKDGFENICRKIGDSTKFTSLEIVSLMCTIIKNLLPLLEGKFVLEYIPRLKEVIWANLLNGPEDHINKFTYEQIEETFETCAGLIEQIYIKEEAQKLLETFNLNICRRLVESQSLSIQIVGLSLNLKFVKNVKNIFSQNFCNLAKTHLSSLIKEKQIINKILDAENYSELIKRYLNILSYMLQERLFTFEDFQRLWSTIKREDQESKEIIYDVFCRNVAFIDKKHFEYMITDLLNIVPRQVIHNECKLVLEISSFFISPSYFKRKCWEFCWQLIFSKESSSNHKIIELSLLEMSKLMEDCAFKEERAKFLDAYVENIREGILVCSLLNFMTKFLKSSNPFFQKVKQNQSYADYLLQEKNITSLIIKDLKALKEKISREINEDGNVSKRGSGLLFSDGESYVEHIKTRIKFIESLFQKRSSEKIIFPYEILDDLWNEMVRKAILPFEIQLMYEFIQQNSDFSLGLPLTKEDRIKFLENNLNNKDIQSHEELNSIRFRCFQSLFNSIKTPRTSEQNFGEDFSNSSKCVVIDILCDFVLKSPESATAREAINCLLSFVCSADRSTKTKFINDSKRYLDKVLKEMGSLSKSAFEEQCSRFLELLNTLMNKSERGGIGNFQSHLKLKKGKLIRFSVKHSNRNNPNVPIHIKLELSSDITVFELRVLVGKKFRAVWNQLELKKSAILISDMDNGRTLSEIQIVDNDEIYFKQNANDPSTKVKLLEGRNNLNPLFEKILAEWFEENSTNSMMSPEQFAQFIYSCTNDGCTPQDSRVKTVFEPSDSDKDGYLTLTDFIQFYIRSCLERPDHVWRNLHAHSYTNELKKATEIQPEEVDITLLPRYMISSDPEYLEILYSLLDLGDKTSELAWDALNRLSTQRQVFANLIKLKGIRDIAVQNQDWNTTLPLDRRYKLLYNLQVITCLVDEEEISEVGKQIREEVFAQNHELLKYKETWRADFVGYGGLEHLIKIFSLYSQEEDKTNKMESTKKEILLLLAKVIGSCLPDTLFLSIENILKAFSFKEIFNLFFCFAKEKAPNIDKSIEFSQFFSFEELEGKENNKSVELKHLLNALKSKEIHEIYTNVNFYDLLKPLLTLGVRVSSHLEYLTPQDLCMFKPFLGSMMVLALWSLQD